MKELSIFNYYLKNILSLAGVWSNERLYKYIILKRNGVRIFTNIFTNGEFNKRTNIFSSPLRFEVMKDYINTYKTKKELH